MSNDPWFLLRDDTDYDRVVLEGPPEAYRLVEEPAPAAGLRRVRVYRGAMPLGLVLDAPPPLAAALCAASATVGAASVVLEAWTDLAIPRAPVGAFIYLDLGARNVEPMDVRVGATLRPLTLIGRAVRLAEARQHPGDLPTEAVAMMARLLDGGPTSVVDQLLAHLHGEGPRDD